MIVVPSRHALRRERDPKDGDTFRHDAPDHTGASWHPILGQSDSQRALEAVEMLARRIARARDDRSNDPSLSGGSAGIAVLYAELERAGMHEGVFHLAANELDHAVDILASAPLTASLYAGFTGVAWAAETVGELLGRGGEDVNEEIDEALLATLARVDWNHAPYDLIVGLTGLGVYALERWPRAAAAEALVRIVDELTRLARKDERGTFWWTDPQLLHPSRREHYPNGGVDLGVAHGIAGVIPFLARVHAVGAVDVDDILPTTVEWLLAHVLETDAGPTIPYYVAENVEPAPSRLGWCYGDAGVAAALLLAARETGQAEWEEAARAIATTAAKRPLAETGVVDAGFCHGSAGLAHLFNRIYQATGDATFRDAALFWLDQTLERVATAGDASPKASDGGSAVNGNGLLEGSAGVALALLATTTSHEPAWDRMFLISTRG